MTADRVWRRSCFEGDFISINTRTKYGRSNCYRLALLVTFQLNSLICHQRRIKRITRALQRKETRRNFDHAVLVLKLSKPEMHGESSLLCFSRVTVTHSHGQQHHRKWWRGVSTIDRSAQGVHEKSWIQDLKIKRSNCRKFNWHHSTCETTIVLIWSHEIMLCNHTCLFSPSQE